jgi:hypothetical protein
LNTSICQLQSVRDPARLLSNLCIFALNSLFSELGSQFGGISIPCYFLADASQGSWVLPRFVAIFQALAWNSAEIRSSQTAHNTNLSKSLAGYVNMAKVPWQPVANQP